MLVKIRKQLKENTYESNTRLNVKAKINETYQGNQQLSFLKKYIGKITTKVALTELS